MEYAAAAGLGWAKLELQQSPPSLQKLKNTFVSMHTHTRSSVTPTCGGDIALAFLAIAGDLNSTTPKPLNFPLGSVAHLMLATASCGWGQQNTDVKRCSSGNSRNG